MLPKIGRTLIQVLPAAVLLTGLVHFAKSYSVSASGIQAADTNTTGSAAANRITFSIDFGLDGEIGDSTITAGDLNRDGQVDVAIANNFGGDHSQTWPAGLPERRHVSYRRRPVAIALFFQLGRVHSCCATAWE